MSSKGLMQRLHEGEKVIVAEGYIFNFEKRCYVQAGPFVPTVVLDYPNLVRQLHEEFVRAGSDVVPAFTYYGHREKLKLINRSGDLESMNRTALRIARDCANNSGTLMAGDICNTNTYDPLDPQNKENMKAIFKEQVEWAVEEGADYIIGETFGILEEALIALDVIKTYGQGVPAVITMAIYDNVKEDKLSSLDGVEFTEAMKRLESAGADVVGLNCFRGPDTMIPLMEKVKRSGVKAYLAALPITYRTTETQPTFYNLTDPKTGKKVFPTNMDCFSSTRDDIFDFGRRCNELGINYVGLCCGNSPHYTRVLAESMGRNPPGSSFSPDMNLHCFYGKDDKVSKWLKSDNKN